MGIKEIIENKSGILSNYISNLLKKEIKIQKIEYLGKGLHGEAYKATTSNNETYIVKEFMDWGLNLEFPEDRISEAIKLKRTANDLPGHVKIFGNLQHSNNEIKELTNENPIIVMEEAKYDEYFSDLSEISKSQELSEKAKQRIKILAEKIAEMHSKKQPANLYSKYLKDWFSLGILELTNELKPICTEAEAKQIKHSFLDWEHILYKNSDRCKRIHGELFPGTIKFGPNNEFVTYDMRRIGAGEPADDVGSVAFNFLLQSILDHKKILPCFEEATKLFLSEYIKHSKDNEITKFLPVYMAYRCLICVHPEIIPIPKETKIQLKKILFTLLKQKDLDLDKIIKQI